MGRMTRGFLCLVCSICSNSHSLYTSRRLIPSSCSAHEICLARSLRVCQQMLHKGFRSLIFHQPSETRHRVNVRLPAKLFMVLCSEAVHCVISIVYKGVDPNLNLPISTVSLQICWIDCLIFSHPSDTPELCGFQPRLVEKLSRCQL
jgi:hypothetical protein